MKELFVAVLLLLISGCSNKPRCTIPANIEFGESFVIPCDNGKAYQIIVNEVAVDKLEVRHD